MAKKAALILNLAAQAAYLASGGSQCPFCQSKDVEAGSFETDGLDAHNEVSCGACGQMWLDVYRLIRVAADKHSEFEVEEPSVYHIILDTITVIDISDVSTMSVNTVNAFPATEDGEDLAKATFKQWVQQANGDNEGEKLTDKQIEDSWNEGKFEVGSGMVMAVRSS